MSPRRTSLSELFVGIWETASRCDRMFMWRHYLHYDVFSYLVSLLTSEVVFWKRGSRKDVLVSLIGVVCLKGVQRQRRVWQRHVWLCGPQWPEPRVVGRALPGPGLSGCGQRVQSSWHVQLCHPQVYLRPGLVRRWMSPTRLSWHARLQRSRHLCCFR